MWKFWGLLLCGCPSRSCHSCLPVWFHRAGLALPRRSQGSGSVLSTGEKMLIPSTTLYVSLMPSCDCFLYRTSILSYGLITWPLREAGLEFFQETYFLPFITESFLCGRSQEHRPFSKKSESKGDVSLFLYGACERILL